MNKILIIIEREFLKRIQKKSFIVLTIVSPLIMAALIFVPLWLSSIENDEQQHVAVIDPSGQYFKALKETETFHFTLVPSLNNEMRSEESPYDAVVSIPRGLLDNKAKVCIYSRKEVPVNLLSYVQTTLDDQVRQQRLKASGIAQLDKIISEVEKGTKVETVKWNDQGDETISSGVVAMVVGFLFTFLIYMFVVGYGGQVMQSVIEEKSSRVLEVVVSSVRPFELMMGKIFGVASVAVVQVLIWAVLVCGAGAAVMPHVLPDGAMEAAAALQQGGGAATAAAGDFDPETLGAIALATDVSYLAMLFGYLLLFVVGGYLLYSAMFAAVGSAVDNAQDAAQLQTPIMIPIILAVIVEMSVLNDPNSPLAFWFSLIPFTSPVVMMARIPYGIPTWEIVLSLVLLYAAFVGMVWLSAKIYRVGIFMYGKKPTLREMFRWIRYKY